MRLAHLDHAEGGPRRLHPHAPAGLAVADHVVILAGSGMVAEYGDGWYAFNLDPAEARAKIARLTELAKANGRDINQIELIVSPYTKQITQRDLSEYRECGVSELVMLMGVPTDDREIVPKLEQMAREWVEPAAKLA